MGHEPRSERCSHCEKRTFARVAADYCSVPEAVIRSSANTLLAERCGAAMPRRTHTGGDPVGRGDCVCRVKPTTWPTHSSRQHPGGAHLGNAEKNERVSLIETRGTVAPDLRGALVEMDAYAVGTRCQKPLYHAAISPDSTPRKPL